eukprot:602468-Prymnesium_polylepis.1
MGDVLLRCSGGCRCADTLARTRWREVHTGDRHVNLQLNASGIDAPCVVNLTHEAGERVKFTSLTSSTWNSLYRSRSLNFKLHDTNAVSRSTRNPRTRASLTKRRMLSPCLESSALRSHTVHDMRHRTRPGLCLPPSPTRHCHRPRKFYREFLHRNSHPRSHLHRIDHRPRALALGSRLTGSVSPVLAHRAEVLSAHECRYVLLPFLHHANKTPQVVCGSAEPEQGPLTPHPNSN